MPFLAEEVTDILRDTAIELEVVDPKTGNHYNKASNINSLLANFLRRCEEKNVPLVPKKGQKLSVEAERWRAEHAAAVAREEARPAGVVGRPERAKAVVLLGRHESHQVVALGRRRWVLEIHSGCHGPLLHRRLRLTMIPLILSGDA